MRILPRSLNLPQYIISKPAIQIPLVEHPLPRFGLFSIRQRLEELGGHLEIESEPGRGCKVTMTAPLKPEEVGKTREE